MWPRSRRWGLALGGWTLAALFFSTQSFINAYIQSSYRNRPLTWREALILGFSEWFGWAALAPLVVWLARRFPIERPHRRRGLVVHSVAGLTVSILKVAGDGLVVDLLGLNPARTITTFRFHPNLLTYAAIVGASHALEYYRRYRDRELRALQLEARLAQAELQMLKLQLDPHFLFNTLHAISALMHRDVEAADRMITRLSDLLRLILESAGVQEVPLKQELEFLERYLEIQQTRFSDRLTVRLDIDPEALNARAPNLILQPLVENAIRHGIAPRSDPGQILIRAARVAEGLLLEVVDDGPGLPEGEAAQREGIGLANTRARLDQLYGTAHRFELAKAPGGGLRASLTIPQP